MLKRPIAISLSPNTEKDDVFLALKTLFNPLKWFDKREVERLELNFATLFDDKCRTFATNSGRSAQYLILKSLGIGPGDEVLIQAFTCVAVPNSILWLSAKPIYVDIDNSYNMDVKDLKRKITKKSKAIVVQHTFGIPTKIDQIKKIAQKNGLYLIEDCAHALGASYKKRPVGTFGDASFFSFGRDKIISSVFGGMALVKAQIKEKSEREVRRLKCPNILWTLQQLLHPIAFSLILPIYNLGLGKLLLVGLQKARLLSLAVYEQEKSCQQPSVFPGTLPPALAQLAVNQLDKLERFNQHRRRVAKYYFSKLSTTNLGLPPNVNGACWLRFPVTLDDASELIKYAKRQGISLGDWYRGVVMPVKDLAKAGYKIGSCLNAERLARMVVNLPTYPTLSMKQAQKVVAVVKEWLGQ